MECLSLEAVKWPIFARLSAQFLQEFCWRTPSRGLQMSDRICTICGKWWSEGLEPWSACRIGQWTGKGGAQNWPRQMDSADRFRRRMYLTLVWSTLAHTGKLWALVSGRVPVAAYTRIQNYLLDFLLGDPILRTPWLIWTEAGAAPLLLMLGEKGLVRFIYHLLYHLLIDLDYMLRSLCCCTKPIFGTSQIAVVEIALCWSCPWWMIFDTFEPRRHTRRDERRGDKP
jgi:hypothetical protein